MKGIRHLSARKAGITLSFCLPVLFQATCTPDARFLDQGCARTPPRPRMGSYASSTVGTSFLGAKSLGAHGYRHSWSEQNGIVYTCKAGHIDIAHVRKAADWTAFLAAKTFERLQKNKTTITFKLKEPSRYRARITYPGNWRDLLPQEKERIACEISIALGAYFSYTANTWHEILTWFGYKCSGIYSEFPSAFSWEDTFSNLLGTHIGAMALRDTEHTYDQAVTLAMNRELEKLDIQTGDTARRASEKVRGLWFSGDFLFFVNTKSRNFDIGLDDGFVTPRLVPSISKCEGAVAQSYPVPSLDVLSEYGFSMRLTIEPREWEKGKILSVVYPDPQERRKRLEPAVHFGRIMDYIRKDATTKYLHSVDPDD